MDQDRDMSGSVNEAVPSGGAEGKPSKKEIYESTIPAFNFFSLFFLVGVFFLLLAITIVTAGTAKMDPPLWIFVVGALMFVVMYVSFAVPVYLTAKGAFGLTTVSVYERDSKGKVTEDVDSGFALTVGVNGIKLFVLLLASLVITPVRGIKAMRAYFAARKDYKAELVAEGKTMPMTKQIILLLVLLLAALVMLIVMIVSTVVGFADKKTSDYTDEERSAYLTEAVTVAYDGGYYYKTYLHTYADAQAKFTVEKGGNIKLTFKNNAFEAYYNGSTWSSSSDKLTAEMKKELDTLNVFNVIKSAKENESALVLKNDRIYNHRCINFMGYFAYDQEKKLLLTFYPIGDKDGVSYHIVFNDVESENSVLADKW